MALVFCDSFDHYDDISLKWTGGQTGIDLTGTLSRTGIGCAVLTGPFGPLRPVPNVTGVGTAYILGTAFYQVASFTAGAAIAFLDIDSVLQDITFLFQVGCGSNGEIFCTDVHNQVQPRYISGPGIVVPNSYNYIECKCFFANHLQGSAIVRVNGQVVLNLQNIDTLDPSRSAIGGVCNNIRLGGIGDTGGTRHDDVYLCDTSGDVNNDFLGAVSIYAVVPSANSTPLEWTPLAGTNFSEVNEIPPDGDTSYVSSASVGLVDQYVYPVTSEVPSNHEVFGVQHSLLTRVPTGSASVASVVGGIAAPGLGIGAIYHYVPIQPYDFNPTTGAGWKLTDFPATVLGPKQTL